MNAGKAPNAYHRRLATAILADVKPVGKDDTAKNVTYRLMYLFLRFLSRRLELSRVTLSHIVDIKKRYRVP